MSVHIGTLCKVLLEALHLIYDDGDYLLLKYGTFTRTFLLASPGATIQTDAQTSENKNIGEFPIKNSDVFAALPPSLWDQNVTPIRNSNRDRYKE